ncbi:hypothetical protein [Actinocrinis sp.]|uniref:hypothetical protein n=1 Tax=Actinocrinis sp. TaxID=1920516 RepID=UPI002D64D6A9|nr:hypothetical protein [Actinocrinis sp.]HZP49646.1 hypothetical protein [Actinocrinis sp.]
MSASTPPLTVQAIAADLCREILADHADWPLALQVPEYTWPRVYERNPACPAIRDSRPNGPCVALAPGGWAVYVHLFLDGHWVDSDSDWRLPYPGGFEDFRSYPEGTRLPLGFRVELVQRIERRLALIKESAQ